MIMKSNKVIKATDSIGITKADIEQAVIQLEFQIAEGNLSGLNCMVRAKVLEETAKAIRASDVIASDAKHDIELGTKDMLGAKVNSTSRSSYSYQDSPLWVNLDSEIKRLTEMKKDIEKQAKVCKGAVIDTETGEVAVMPAKVVGGSDSISISLKK